MSSPLIISGGKPRQLGTGVLEVNSIEAITGTTLSLGTSSEVISIVGGAASFATVTDVLTLTPASTAVGGIRVSCVDEGHWGVQVISAATNKKTIIRGGVITGATGGYSLSVSGGLSSSSASGSLNLSSMNVTGAFVSGDVSIFTGNVSGAADSGDIKIYTGYGQTATQSGGIVIETNGGSTITPVNDQILMSSSEIKLTGSKSVTSFASITHTAMGVSAPGAYGSALYIKNQGAGVNFNTNPAVVIDVSADFEVPGLRVQTYDLAENYSTSVSPWGIEGSTFATQNALPLYVIGHHAGVGYVGGPVYIAGGDGSPTEGLYGGGIVISSGFSAKPSATASEVIIQGEQAVRIGNGTAWKLEIGQGGVSQNGILIGPGSSSERAQYSHTGISLSERDAVATGYTTGLDYTVRAGRNYNTGATRGGHLNLASGKGPSTATPGGVIISAVDTPAAGTTGEITIESILNTTFYANGSNAINLNEAGFVNLPANITSIVQGLNLLSGLGTNAITIGAWTPTLTNVSNFVSATSANGTYIRAGNFVLAFARLAGVTVTAATTTDIRLTPPVASNFAGDDDAGGYVGGTATTEGMVRVDGVNNELRAFFSTSTTAARDLTVLAAYKII